MKICGRRSLLPKSLPIPLYYNPIGTPLYAGEVADVWKGRYNGQDVAAKVLRVQTSDLEQTREAGFPQLVPCISKLIMSIIAILQAGRDMEYPSSSECAAVVGCRDD